MEEETKVEGGEATEGGKSGRNKLLMFMIIGLLLLLIGAIVFVAILLLGMRGGQDEEYAYEEAVPQYLRIDQLEFLELSRAISTNIRSESGGSHVFSASFIIAVDGTMGRESQNMIELLAGSDSILRSVALRVVRQKTFEQLSHQDAMANLEQEVLHELRHEFGTSLINRVMIGGDWFVD